MVIGLISKYGSVRKSFNIVLFVLNSNSIHKHFNEKKKKTVKVSSWIRKLYSKTMNSNSLNKSKMKQFYILNITIITIWTCKIVKYQFLFHEF